MLGFDTLLRGESHQQSLLYFVFVKEPGKHPGRWNLLFLLTVFFSPKDILSSKYTFILNLWGQHT